MWWRTKWPYNLYMWVLYRIHPRHKYNLLKTGLPPGYYDLDTRLLYSIMNEFKEFYENPNTTTYKTITFDIDSEIENMEEFEKDYFNEVKDIKHEMDTVYAWWLNYLKLQKTHTQLWNSRISNIDGRALLEKEDQLEDEANEMLIRLMKIRRHLWD